MTWRRNKKKSKKMGIDFSYCCKQDKTYTVLSQLFGSECKSDQKRYAKEHRRDGWSTLPCFSAPAVDLLRSSQRPFFPLPLSLLEQLDPKQDVFWINVQTHFGTDVSQINDLLDYNNLEMSTMTQCYRCGLALPLRQRAICGILPTMVGRYRFRLLWFTCSVRCSQAFLANTPPLLLQ